MDKIREEFEAWYWGIYGPCHALSINEVFSVDPFGVYSVMMPRVAYEAWKASRAALCVELPEVRVLDGGRIAEIGYELAVDDFEEALDAAGIRYT